ncbi:MAG: hypothetical protein H6741_16855 [Alphaproteobacteria bacterium]|nr:hypothetical protein [Alphaproteobacteria bacterium]
MRFALGIAALGLTVACAAEPVGEDLFEVVSAVPEDGAVADGGSRLELRLSAAADPALCTPENIGVVAITDEGFVAFEVELDIEMADGGNKLTLTPAAELLSGYRYAYAVRAGSEACLDVDGRSLQPFYAEFTVP